MRKTVELVAPPATRGDPCVNRTANILGALAIALNDRIVSETGAVSGMSPSSASALIQVYFYPGISVEQLKNQIGLSHSASVRVVDLLEDSGHVERRRITETDARVISLFITDKGRDLALQILDLRNNITRKIVVELPPDDQSHLERIVIALISKLVRPGLEQELVCRFCDLSSCPQETCPMTLMDGPPGKTTAIGERVS